MVFFKTKFCRAGKPIDNSIEKHSTYHNSNAYNSSEAIINSRLINKINLIEVGGQGDLTWFFIRIHVPSKVDYWKKGKVKKGISTKVCIFQHVIVNINDNVT